MVLVAETLWGNLKDDGRDDRTLAAAEQSLRLVGGSLLAFGDHQLD